MPFFLFSVTMSQHYFTNVKSQATRRPVHCVEHCYLSSGMLLLNWLCGLDHLNVEN